MTSVGLHPKTIRLIRLIFLEGRLKYSDALKVYENERSFKIAVDNLVKQGFIKIHEDTNPEKTITLTPLGYLTHIVFLA